MFNLSTFIENSPSFKDMQQKAHSIIYCGIEFSSLSGRKLLISKLLPLFGDFSLKESYLVLTQTIPDVIIFKHNNLSPLLISDIDNVISEAKIMPLCHQTKVIIISLEKPLSGDLQNKLLKLLETSPTYLKFLLITSSKEWLLPTIVSRLVFLDFSFDTNNKNKEIMLRKINDQLNESLVILIKEILLKLDSYEQVLEYIFKLKQLKCNLKVFLNTLFEILKGICYQETQGHFATQIYEKYSLSGIRSLLFELLELEPEFVIYFDQEIFFDFILFKIIEFKKCQ